jgi:glucose/arabinose dehydrogenase
VALTVNPADTTIYAVSQGRDALHDLWPSLYSADENATAAAEELIRITATRADFGWPYCYYDYNSGTRVLAPEYGGDKTRTDRCDRLIQPLVPFPAHWAPMSIVFYTGKMFPAAYRGGAFIAFHGSAFRAPLPQEGYHVVYLQFKDGMARGLQRVRERLRRRNDESGRRRPPSGGVGRWSGRRTLSERRQGRAHLENYV